MIHAHFDPPLGQRFGDPAGPLHGDDGIPAGTKLLPPDGFKVIGTRESEGIDMRQRQPPRGGMTPA